MKRWPMIVLNIIGVFLWVYSGGCDFGFCQETNTKTDTGSPLVLTIEQAIALCLESNRSLVVERLKPAIRHTFEDEEQAAFDPVISGSVTAERDNTQRLSKSANRIEDIDTDVISGRIGLKQFFPTGTTLTLSADTEVSTEDSDSFAASRLGGGLTQSLLRGFGRDVNYVRLRQARLDTRLSDYELRAFTESLVAEVERTYWDLALAGRRTEIYEESLKLARQQLKETEELIAIGRFAESELPAVQAEVASQQQGRINARSDAELSRLRLLRLLNPQGSGFWEQRIQLMHQPTLPDIQLDPAAHYVDEALRMQPLINQAKLGLLRGDLQIVETKNGLLPILDVFITLGKSGYAKSFGASTGHLGDDRYDVGVGLQMEFPFRNREARALHQRALLGRDQAQKAVSNLTQLVEMEVRTAHIEVHRTQEQISASTATRKLNDEKLRIETEKFRVGRSTNLLVSQAQRDLLVSRIAEVEALIDYLKALISLYEEDGTLLLRRGIDAPGAEAVEGSGSDISDAAPSGEQKNH